MVPYYEKHEKDLLKYFKKHPKEHKTVKRRIAVEEAIGQSFGKFRFHVDYSNIRDIR